VRDGVCVFARAQASYARVMSLLRANEAKLALLAQALLEHETLTSDQCKDVVEGRPIVAKPLAPAQPTSLWGKLTAGTTVSPGAAAATTAPVAAAPPAASP
jgi:hypothetical protein